MPEKTASSKQDIVSGDSSSNYQAARDINVHNHPALPGAQSLIQKPTNAEIAKYDPKTAKIIRAASEERILYARNSMSSLLGLFLLAILGLSIYELVAWLARLLLR